MGRPREPPLAGIRFWKCAGRIGNNFIISSPPGSFAQVTVADTVTYRWQRSWGGRDIYVVGAPRSP